MKNKLMNKHIFSLLSILLVGKMNAQTFTHPTVGVNGTYAGNCLVNTCSGTYYDNGGLSMNYSDGINQVYRVFCPDQALNCVRLTFTSFDVQAPGIFGCVDYLTVGNGSTQNSPAILLGGVTDGTGRICGTPATPFTFTASSANGCLSLRFRSNASNNRPGWAATLSCVPCAGGPTGTDQTDCANRVQVCNNQNITWNSPGPGLISESCSGCAIQEGEDHSAWYIFSPATSGTIGLTITPANPSDDYDFIIYGPGATCSSLGPPIRCSYACTPGPTGMNAVNFDVTEQCGPGNGWLSQMPVLAGQVYYMQINHWDPPISGYTLSWQLSGGATLDCTPLPVELNDFSCDVFGDEVIIYWSTSAEVNSNYFVVEKSIDEINYTEIARINGKGFSNEKSEYMVGDPNPTIGTNYYRLRQVDFNGNERLYYPTSCDYGLDLPTITSISVYDLNGHLILTRTENTQDLESIIKSLQIKAGMYVLYTTYNDGTVKMRKFVKI